MLMPPFWCERRSYSEPIARYGPFVMNMQDELIQAMKDYQVGKMGLSINGRRAVVETPKNDSHGMSS